jgi:cytidyltransferase-like protein
MKRAWRQGEMDLSEQDEKELLKSIYLLQIRRSSFTKTELMEKTGLDTGTSDDVLRQFTISGTLERRDTDKYALLPKGRSKLRVVLVGGVYDILHLGHLVALAEAKTHGDLLVVVVATDTTVEILKGRRPVFPEEDRRALVESLKPVDAAILGYEDVGMGYEQVIDDVKPDIIALGYDQDSVARTVTELVERKGLKVRIVRLTKFDREKYLSSSAIRQRFFRETG